MNTNTPVVYINGINFYDISRYQQKKWIYPGGEIGVIVDGITPNMTKQIDVVCRIQCADDLIELIMTANALFKNFGIKIDNLLIPYLPYARQDRIANVGDPHALSVFASLIQTIGVNTVHVVDAHSNVAEACFDKVRFCNHSNIEYVRSYLDGIPGLLENHRNNFLICPDEGAIKKTQALARTFDARIQDVIYCTKKRDPATGKLSGFSVQENKNVNADSNLILVDDIIDGGGTFIGIADVLSAQFPNAKRHLFATHGIFSRGTNCLYEKFDSVGCTNSFTPNPEIENQKPATVIPL